MTSELAQTFLATGADYDKFRPGFPDAALAVVVPGHVGTALDLGAGTGKLTKQLVRRADRVTAVDPSAQMLAELRRSLPEVEAIEATAEQIPLPPGSQDVVTVAQAFHWFDREPASAEIARVLAPGGRLGLLWNGPVAECAWDSACYEIAHPGSRSADPGALPEPASPPGFRLLETRDVRWHETITRADYLSRWLTVSTFLLASPTQRADMLAAVGAVLDADPETAGADMLELPMSTWVEVYEAL